MLRLAVIGDLHFLDPPSHGLLPGASLSPDAVRLGTDAERYHTFTERVFPALAAEIADAKPDLILHTGDLAETGYREPAGSRELAFGLRQLTALGAPVVLCRGNHDGDVAWPEICGTLSPARWEGPGLQLLTLDYPTFAPADALARLELALDEAVVRAGRTGARIMLAAHAPAHGLARPFFTDQAYAAAITALARRYPIEVLFCGHTHNQAWSLHPAGRGRALLQVKGAAVGLPGGPGLPLPAVRAICGGPEGCQLLWGFLEDTAPGWNELILGGRWAILRWHALGRGVLAEARLALGTPLELAQGPEVAPPDRGPWPGTAEIDSAWLAVAGYGGGAGRTVWLNGQVAGVLPELGAFAPRRRVELPPAALAPANVVEIATAGEDRLLVGALAIEARLTDGRTLRTPVDPWLHATTATWDTWQEPALRRTAPGSRLRAALNFANG